MTTTIDAHLPLVIALVLLCAWLVRGTRWSAAVQCAVPLLVVAMMTITDVGAAPLLDQADVYSSILRLPRTRLNCFEPNAARAVDG